MVSAKIDEAGVAVQHIKRHKDSLFQSANRKVMIPHPLYAESLVLRYSAPLFLKCRISCSFFFMYNGITGFQPLGFKGELSCQIVDDTNCLISRQTARLATCSIFWFTCLLTPCLVEQLENSLLYMTGLYRIHQAEWPPIFRRLMLCGTQWITFDGSP